MSRKHAPSLMRQIRRELKEGKSPESLFPKVKSISDSYYRSLSFYLLIPYLSPKSKQFKQKTSKTSNASKAHSYCRRKEVVTPGFDPLPKLEGRAPKVGGLAANFAYSAFFFVRGIVSFEGTTLISFAFFVISCGIFLHFFCDFVVIVIGKN